MLEVSIFKVKKRQIGSPPNSERIIKGDSEMNKLVKVRIFEDYIRDYYDRYGSHQVDYVSAATQANKFIEEVTQNGGKVKDIQLSTKIKFDELRSSSNDFKVYMDFSISGEKEEDRRTGGGKIEMPDIIPADVIMVTYTEPKKLNIIRRKRND